MRAETADYAEGAEMFKNTDEFLSAVSACPPKPCEGWALSAVKGF
jgi:hypothetical protein